jgi:hypothetical protein
MADAFSLPMAEIAVLLGEGKLKARALAEEAIANHERFGPKLMAYSQWAPEHARNVRRDHPVCNGTAKDRDELLSPNRSRLLENGEQSPHFCQQWSRLPKLPS